MWLLPGAASVAVCLAAAIWYMQRPLPRLRIAKYTQITFDGQRKGVFARVYLDSDSPNLPSQMAASGGDRVPLRIAVPGRQFGICDVSPDGSELLIAALPDDSEVPGLWTQSILGGTFRRLAESESGGFSPDGKSVAYVSEDQTEIDIVNLDGTGARRLASPGPCGWRNRAGRRMERASVLIETANCGRFPPLERIFIYCCQAGNVPGEQLSGRWSPDGRFYFFLVGGWGGQIWAIDERRRFLYLGNKLRNRVQLTSRTHSLGQADSRKRRQNDQYAVGETRVGALMRFDQKTGLFAPFPGRHLSRLRLLFSARMESLWPATFPSLM